MIGHAWSAALALHPRQYVSFLPAVFPFKLQKIRLPTDTSISSIQLHLPLPNLVVDSKEIWAATTVYRLGFTVPDHPMKEEFVDAVEKSFRIVGAEDYESGMEQARKLIAFAQAWIEALKTPDDLRAMLDKAPPLSKREEMAYLRLAKNLPHVLRLGLKVAAKKAATDSPGLASGRPAALSRQKAREALDYVSKLNRTGCSFEAAKLRASMKFGCSPRTIERLWKERKAYQNDEPCLKSRLTKRLLTFQNRITPQIKKLSCQCERGEYGF